jgi:hypothetical protein
MEEVGPPVSPHVGRGPHQQPGQGEASRAGEGARAGFEGRLPVRQGPASRAAATRPLRTAPSIVAGRPVLVQSPASRSPGSASRGRAGSLPPPGRTRTWPRARGARATARRGPPPWPSRSSGAARLRDGGQLRVGTNGGPDGRAHDEREVLRGALAPVEPALVEHPLHLRLAQAGHRPIEDDAVEPELDRHDRGAAQPRRRGERGRGPELFRHQRGQGGPRHRGHHRVRFDALGDGARPATHLVLRLRALDVVHGAVRARPRPRPTPRARAGARRRRAPPGSAPDGRAGGRTPRAGTRGGRRRAAAGRPRERPRGRARPRRAPASR